MLKTAPHLHTRRPSPTAVEFKVSTVPPLTTPLRIALYALYVGRVLVSLSVALLLVSTWATSPYFAAPQLLQPPSSATDWPPTFSSAFVLRWLAAVLRSAPGRLALAAASAVPAWLLVPACGVLLYAATLRIHTEERLLVLRGLGVQTSSTPGTVLGSAVTRFIPTEKIQDVLINEAFRGFEVRYYLVVVVEGEEDLVVVFPKLLPRRKIVEVVWRGVRECLYEPKDSSGGGGGARGRGAATSDGTHWKS